MSDSLIQLNEPQLEAIFATWVYEQLSRGGSLLGVDLFDAEEPNLSQFAVIATRLGYMLDGNSLSASDFVALLNQRDEFINLIKNQARLRVSATIPDWEVKSET